MYESGGGVIVTALCKTRVVSLPVVPLSYTRWRCGVEYTFGEFSPHLPSLYFTVNADGEIGRQIRHKQVCDKSIDGELNYVKS